MLNSLISEGVFVEFPRLKVVLMESGVTWLPGWMWRANKTWRGVRAEVPWLEKSPSEIVREHVRLTVQPFDAPPRADQLQRIIEEIGSDEMLLFSTDYPHWHFDGNDALPDGLPESLMRKILVDNPLKTYPPIVRVKWSLSDERHGHGSPSPIPRRRAKLGFVDCDVHPYTKSPAELDPFLSERWREASRVDRRPLARSRSAKAPNYPRMSPGTGMRMDSWPKDGTHPGSDLAMMQAQLLDLFDVSYGLMMPLLGRGSDERNVEFGAAMATAANEWEAQVWCDPEPRLKAGVQITAGIHRSRDRGDREARRRPPLHPGDDPAARAGAAGTSPLLADPGGVRRERLLDRAASRRHQRPSLDRRRLAVVLSRGASVLSAEQGGAGHQPGDRGRVRAHPQSARGAGGGRLRLAAVADAGGSTSTASGCARKCRT